VGARDLEIVPEDLVVGDFERLDPGRHLLPAFEFRELGERGAFRRSPPVHLREMARAEERAGFVPRR